MYLDHIKSYVTASIYLGIAVQGAAREKSDDLSELESILTHYSGPVAKFVIKKQLGDRDFKGMDNKTRMEFIENVVTCSVFDPKKQAEIKAKLVKMYVSTEPV